MARKIEILDTTLRDGNKLPFIVLSTADRLAIAEQLSRLGVDIVEAGFPVSSREEKDCVSLIAREVKGPQISALARALERDIEVALEALERAEKPYLHIFMPVSESFLSSSLKASHAEAVRTITRSIELGKRSPARVQFSLGEAPHADRGFLREASLAAVEAKVDVLNIADTNGVLVPEQARELVELLRQTLGASPLPVIGIHFHNDFGLATANTLASIFAGACHAEVTIGGFGERSGNAALEEVAFLVAASSRRTGISHQLKLGEIHATAQLLSHFTGVRFHPNKPVIGRCAFAEAPGSRSRNSLEPELRSLLHSKTIGRPTDRIFGTREMGFEEFKEQCARIGVSAGEKELERLYELYMRQSRRKQEVSVDELLAMVCDAREGAAPYYVLASFSVFTGSGAIPVGIVEIRRGEKILKGESIVVQSAHGSGPVDALCKAVDRAIGFFPKLVLYSVDAVSVGKDALAEVTVTVEFKGKRFRGHYGSTDVIEASLRAYLDAMGRIASSGILETPGEFYIEGEYLWE